MAAPGGAPGPFIGRGPSTPKPPAPKPPPPPPRIPVSGTNLRGGIVTPRSAPPPRPFVSTTNLRGGISAPPPPAPTPDPKSTIAVFRAQPLKQQQQIVKGAMQHPTVPASKIILNFVKSSGNYQDLVVPLHGSSVLSGLGKLLNPANVYGGGAAGSKSGGAAQTGMLGSTGTLTPFAPGTYGRQLAKVPLLVGKATVEQPSVIPKTLAGLGTQALAAGAALGELPIKVATEGPGAAISQTAKGIASDYSQRYGPLLAGNDQAFIDRIKKQGAAPEVLDALGLIGGVDATAGRGLTALGKLKEAATGEANVLTRARPVLRISGNETRQQGLARGAMKISAQRAEDRLRQIIHKPDRPGEVAPLFQGRAQRVLVSGIQADARRGMQDTLNKEVRGRSGIQGDFRKLSPWEKKAATLVHEGWVPLRSGKQAALDALQARKQAILKDRVNPKSVGNRIAPKDLAKVDDVRLIDQLHANVDKWLTPNLAAFVDKQGARAMRVARGDERGLTQSAEARLLRPQAETLGIKHPDEIAQGLQGAREVASRGSAKSLLPLRSALTRERAIGRNASFAEKYANYQEARPGLLQDYIDSVRAKRPKMWPEPSYMEHTMRPKENFGAFTQGSGHKATPGYKQSQFDLWRGGAIYRDPQMMVDSVARGIKGHYQWPMVDELWRRNGLPAPTADAIKAALGHHKAPSRLTGYELARAYDHMGVDLRSYRFGNPGRLSEATLSDLGYYRGHEKMFGSRAGYMPPELETSSPLADALHGSNTETVMDGREIHAALHSGRSLPADSPFLKSYGWKAVPTEAFKEIHSGLTPSGLGARVAGKGMGLTAGLILGGSPSFVVMNTLAHALLTTFATRGRILTDAMKAPLWYHGLSPEERATVDAQARGRGHYAVQKLGSTVPGALRDSWRGFQQSLPGHALGHLNPVGALWKAEDAQSNFFRRVAYYSTTKHLAFENMGKELGLANQATQKFMHAFDVGPKDQMAAILHYQPWAEEAGRRVVNALGDYARFTHRERTLGRGVLFYSFLRHVTRNLFYVLPFKHPVATALVGALGQMHKDEVQKILGPNPAAWTYGRVFFDKNGKLTSIDMTRALPVGGLPTDVASQGVKGLANAIPPIAQPLLDMIERQTVSGQKVPANAFALLNEIASLSYPYRLGKDLAFGTTLQQPDSIPGIHPRPETRKSASGQAYLQAKEQALGPLHQLVLSSLLGVYPRPDDSRVIAQHAAAGGQGAYKLGGGGGAATGGGYVLGSGGQSSSGSSGYVLGSGG